MAQKLPVTAADMSHLLILNIAVLAIGHQQDGCHKAKKADGTVVNISGDSKVKINTPTATITKL